MRVAITAAALLLVLGARLNGANYYIDYSGGADANAGTSVTSPWKHCPGDPAATGSAAACALAPGDRVYFRGGVTYVLAGATGILLQHDGASGAPIVYESSSDGAWGVGRAKFSDNHGGNAVTAFFTPGARRHLAFRNLEFAQIGGAASLPADTGSPVAPRFGGGIGFGEGATDVTISDCVFRELGYWSSQRPMSAESIAGTAIATRFTRGLSVVRCEFARVAVGCDFAQLDDASAVQIIDCRFREAVVWSIKLPQSVSGTRSNGLSVRGCDELEDHHFDFASWSGYGNSPRVGIAFVRANDPFTLTVGAFGSPAPAFQWHRNGFPIPGATNAKLTLPSTSLLDAGIYTAVATNPAGRAMSNAVVLVVTPYLVPSSSPLVTPSTGQIAPPTITLQPLSQTVASLTDATFTVAASGTSPAFQWRKNGVAISGATNATLTLPAVTTNDAANYTVAVANPAGSVVSAPATLTVNALPTVSIQPSHQIVTPLAMATFTAVVGGTPPVTLQWHKNGAALPGATSSTLTLARVTAHDVATYAVHAVNAVGSVVSDHAVLALAERPPSPPLPPQAPPPSPPPSRTNGGTIPAGPGKTLIEVGPGPASVSFAVTGAAARKLLVRAIGPSLSAFGATGALADPKLELYAGDVLISQNDNWGGHSFFRTTFAEVGAFPLDDSESKDAVIYAGAPPGAYRAVVMGANGATGTVLLEVFELP